MEDDLRDRIFKYQKTCELTQTEMACSLNISQATYNNWVNKKKGIHLKHYPIISQVCGIDILPFVTSANFTRPPVSSIKDMRKDMQRWKRKLHELNKKMQELKRMVVDLKKQIDGPSKENKNDMLNTGNNSHSTKPTSLDM